MPNQPPPTHMQANFYVPIVLYAQFKKRAAALGMSMSEIVTAHMLQTAGTVKLTEEEYAKCIARIEENKRKLKSKRQG